MTLRIGLTGGIACGKSAVAAEFVRLGVPVIDADKVAREVTARGQPALAELAALVPDESIVVDGELDRRRLRELIFRKPALRQRVEAVLHPRIIERMNTRAAASNAPYVVLAIPLLVESGMTADVDRVVVVDCPEEQQVERLMRRDGETDAGARRILAAQASRTARQAAADDVIDNSGWLEALRDAVQALHERYLRIAG